MNSMIGIYARENVEDAAKHNQNSTIGKAVSVSVAVKREMISTIGEGVNVGAVE